MALLLDYDYSQNVVVKPSNIVNMGNGNGAACELSVCRSIEFVFEI